MNLSYFLECKSLEEAKAIYRKRTKELHPDINPNINQDLFKELVNQWEYINKENVEFPLVKKKETIVEDVPVHIPHKKLIDDICRMRMYKGYQLGWIYFTFRSTVKFKNEKITEDDIRYIAFKCGYAEGYVYHKIQELKNESLWSN